METKLRQARQIGVRARSMSRRCARSLMPAMKPEKYAHVCAGSAPKFGLEFLERLAQRPVDAAADEHSVVLPAQPAPQRVLDDEPVAKAAVTGTKCRS